MKLDSLLIGEIESYTLLEITNSIMDLSVDLTSSMVSELAFSVYDNYFNMFNSRYFIAGRRVTFNGEEYEIARVDVQLRNNAKTIRVRARSRATERMRFDKGNKSFGNISPSIFAANMADQYGLKIFAEDSPADGEIKQQSNDDQYESIWDVLSRLASGLDFMLFEARGVLFFASRKFIIENNTNPDFKVHSFPTEMDDNLIFYATSLSFSISEDSKTPYSGSAALLPNAATESLYPGCVITLPSLPHYSDIKFLVERVGLEAGPEKLVQISFASDDTLEERMCTTQQFYKGTSGDCVKRIQTAVKTIVDGKFGPVTEKAVKTYQTFYGLPSNGIVDSATWNVIDNPPYPYVLKTIFSGGGNTNPNTNPDTDTDTVPPLPPTSLDLAQQAGLVGSGGIWEEGVYTTLASSENRRISASTVDQYFRNGTTTPAPSPVFDWPSADIPIPSQSEFFSR